MKIIQMIVCFGIVALFVSCKKNSEEDTAPPVITITTPAASQVYAAGASVNIAGTVTDNGLHQLVITITNIATSAVLYTKTISVHNLTAYTINESWVNNVSAGTNARVKVEAEDMGNNKVEKTVQVVLNP